MMYHHVGTYTIIYLFSVLCGRYIFKIEKKGK